MKNEYKGWPLAKILDLIFNSLMCEGGDGDAIWYTRTPIKEIVKLIEQYDKVNDIGFDVNFINDDTIAWGQNQEWAIITNDKERFDSSRSTIILKIKTAY